ncbi:MAG: MFS transporter [Acidimicrobiales bacterium]|nr:MFS transporter [Acidimicrobiales bacterium]
MKFRRFNASALATHRTLAPIYMCGILGPFGGTVMSPMIPELRASFDTTTATIAWGIGAFFFPFAGLLLVSGTLGEKWGRERTIRAAVALYAMASVTCAVSSSLWVFFLGRAAQGSFNAFMTPLLIATLTDFAPRDRVGRAVGTYASFQALGGVLGMLVGGIAADIGWRWAFSAVALVALGLATKLPKVPVAVGSTAPGIRSVLNKRMLIIGLVALTQAIGPGGLQLLVALVGRDIIGLSGSATGALLITGSLTAAIATPRWGAVIDRIGARKGTAIALLSAMGASIILSQIDTTVPLIVVWAFAGAAIQCISTGFQFLAATGSPSNRGGGISLVLSHRFLGHAIGPLLWVPVFERNISMAYLGAAAVGALSIAFVYASQHDTLASLSES